jgi:impB/mucB/samB family C-terminal domain
MSTPHALRKRQRHSFDCAFDDAVTATPNAACVTQGAPAPFKHLGHGSCDNFSRSATLPTAEDQPGAIGEAAIALLLGLKCPPLEIRGLGVHVAGLVDAATGVPIADGGGGGVKVRQSGQHRFAAAALVL